MSCSIREARPASGTASPPSSGYASTRHTSTDGAAPLAGAPRSPGQKRIGRLRRLRRGTREFSPVRVSEAQVRHGRHLDRAVRTLKLPEDRGGVLLDRMNYWTASAFRRGILGREPIPDERRVELILNLRCLVGSPRLGDFNLDDLRDGELPPRRAGAVPLRG